MEYYIMLADRDFKNPFTIDLSEKDIACEESKVDFSSANDSAIFVDLIVKRFLFRTYFMLSDELQRVFAMYDQTLTFKPIFATNKNKSQNKVYWRVDIEETKNAIVNDFINVKDMIVDENIVICKPIHRINYEKQAYIIINIYVVESIARRLPLGIKFVPIHTANEEGEEFATYYL